MNVGTRFQRQLDILKPDVCGIKVCVVGCGATGSFVTLSLAKMGFSNIKVFDKDTVEEHNFPNQMFPIEALNVNKATALSKVVKDYTGVEIEAIPEFYKNQELEGIVISALDSMKGRKLIYKNCKANNKVEVIFDPRTGPEMFRLLTVHPSIEASRKLYEKNFHTDKEAVQLPCTARAIIYSVQLVSAYICNQVKRYVMGQPLKRDMYIDMANFFSYAE